MNAEHPGSTDLANASAEGHALERTAQQQQTKAELATLSDTVEVEASAETPAQRTKRLGEFVEAHFATVCPSDFLDAGIEVCQADEDECREVFEDPELKLETEDANDPELIGKVEAAVALAKTKAEVSTTASIDEAALDTENGMQKTIEASEVQQREAATENKILKTDIAEGEQNIATTRETNKNLTSDVENLKQLQSEFAEAKAANGGNTIVALRSLLASDQLKSPQIREYLQNTIATAEALTTALPGKSEVVTRLLNASSLDLSAGGGAATFGDFMTAVDASEEFTADDKAKLRAVVHDPRNIKTGSDYAAAMDATKQSPDGETVPAYTKDEPLQFRAGVEGYASANGQQQFMRATTENGYGWELDVTNFTSTEKGLAANLLELWAMTENAGETDFLVSLTKTDLSVNNAIDPLALRDAAMITNATLGGYAGYNGEIFHGTDQIGIIRWQAQLRSPKGDAARSDRNAEMTDDALQGLRIRDKNGQLDMDVLKAFGEYSRDNWFGAPDYEAVQTHLTKLFPEKFAYDGTS